MIETSFCRADGCGARVKRPRGAWSLCGRKGHEIPASSPVAIMDTACVIPLGNLSPGESREVLITIGKPTMTELLLACEDAAAKRMAAQVHDDGKRRRSC